MTHDSRLTDLVASLPATVPFVGPEQQERARGRAFQARLGANEMGFGPSPRAIQAMQDATKEIWKYGDPTSHDLTEALCAHLDIAPDAIVIGEGIDGLLGVLVRMLVAPGTDVVTSLGTYPTFNYHVAGYGGRLHTVPYHNDQPDLAGLAAKAREVGARIVYLANPDNPMGCMLPRDAVSDCLDRLPQDCLLVLDEAYVEFARQGVALPINTTDPRVIHMRTFSKAYGLAGARIAYAIGAPDLIGAFDRVRNHFGVNRLAQAGALAALNDTAYMAQVLDHVSTAKTRITQIAAAHNLRALPSATNFVTIDCGQDGDFARAVVHALGARDVFIRMPFVAPQDRCLRISCGPKVELDLLAQHLPDALAAAAD